MKKLLLKLKDFAFSAEVINSEVSKAQTIQTNLKQLLGA